MSNYQINEDTMYLGPRMERMRKRQQETNVVPILQQQKIPATVLPKKRKTKRTILSAKQQQQETSSQPRTENIGVYLIYASAFLFLLAEIAISLINGYMQANDDIPDIIAEANKYLPTIRNLGAVFAMFGSVSIGGWLGWSIYVVMLGVSLLNNLQWTHTTSTQAHITQEQQRYAALEAKYDIPTLKRRYEDASAKEASVIRSKELECAKASGKGTLCDKYERTIIKPATDSKDTAWKVYTTAMSKVDAQAKTETRQIGANWALIINTILPLLGGLLFKMVTRR